VVLSGEGEGDKGCEVESLQVHFCVFVGSEPVRGDALVVEVLQQDVDALLQCWFDNEVGQQDNKRHSDSERRRTYA
jgi:hypothetical protein